MKQKHGVIFASLALGCLILAACVIDIPLIVERGGWGPEGAPYDTGGEFISAGTFGYPGTFVTVRFRLENGYIREFTFTGGYTATWQSVVAPLRAGWVQTVINSNTFDFPVIGSGATATLRGIRTAGRNALIDEFESISADDFTLTD